MDTLIEAKVPDQLARQAQALVNQGWASDFNAPLLRVATIPTGRIHTYELACDKPIKGLN